MTQTLDAAQTLTLRQHAQDALRRARRMPVGPARNDLRQLAIGLRSLDARRRDATGAGPVDVPSDEAPLAPF